MGVATTYKVPVMPLRPLLIPSRLGPVHIVRPARIATRIVAACALLVTAVACQAPLERSGPLPTTDSATGAELIERAMRSSTSEAALLYLRAAEVFFEEGSLNWADDSLGRVASVLLGRDDVVRFLALTVDVAIGLGDMARAQRAARQLQAMSGGTAAGAVGAHVQAAEGRYDVAVRMLITAAATAQEPATHHDLIWRYLGFADNWTMMRGTSAIDPTERGWWLLKYRLMTAASIADQQARVLTWRTEYPGHPAAVVPPSGVRVLETLAWAPGRIALFLPVSGSLASVGRSVRDGMIGAYLAGLDPDGTPAYDIVVYDTASDSVAALYEAALADSVDVIVGPLAKPRVADLAALDPVLPVVALNYLDPLPTEPGTESDTGRTAPEITPTVTIGSQVAAGQSPGSEPSGNGAAEPAASPALPPFWQMGLAIEDEARAIATRLLDSGHRKAVVFRGTSDWSGRGVDALMEALAPPATTSAVGTTADSSRPSRSSPVRSAGQCWWKPARNAPTRWPAGWARRWNSSLAVEATWMR